MDWLLVVLVVLWTLSAVLPIVGLIGLWQAATREAREIAAAAPTATPDDVSIAQDTAMKKLLMRAISGRPAAARLDFFLIGGGIALGFLADLLSLARP